MNKKGDIFQIIFFLILLLIISIVGILFYALTDKVGDAWDDSELLEEGSIAKESSDIIQANAPAVTDEFVFFMFLGMIIALIIAAVKTNFSPTVIFLFIIVLIIAVFIAAGFTNLYQGFAQGDDLAEYSANLTLTNIVWSRFTPLFICILGGIILIIMYGKSGGDIVT